MDRDALKRLQRHTKDILSRNSADRRVAAVDGYLLALETLHEDANLSVSFIFERIDGTADRAHDAVVRHLGPGLKVDLVPLDDWKRQLSKDLPGFLFTIPNEKARRRLADALVALLNRACSDTASAWHVATEPTDNKYYHCDWQTYLFPTPHGLFLLHCAIDD